MSGYKETVFRYEPKALWTFDLDRISDGLSSIYDEMGNVNPMIRIGDTIELEELSLNDLETTDQFSVAVNRDEKSAGNGNWDSNTGFEVIDSADFVFPNLGTFTVEFFYYKAKPNEIRRYNSSTDKEPGWARNINSPMISKGSMLNVYMYDYWGSNASDGLYVTMFNGTRSVNCLHSSEYPVFERNNHVIITYDVIQTDITEYESKLKLYVNGRLWGTSTATHIDNPPVTDVSDSWFFAKNGTGNDPVINWNTELLRFDQIAVYDYAFNEEQINHHYRKTKTYSRLIQDDYPLHYWNFADADDITSNVVDATVGTNGKLYYESITDAQRGLSGPDKLVGSGATNFTNGSMASITSYDYLTRPNQIFDPSIGYTMDFWFKTGESRRRVLLSCTEETRRWQGLTLMINANNDLYDDGRITVYESLTQYVVTDELDPDTGARLDWSDNEWHHLSIRRNSTHLYIYIDGKVQATLITPQIANNAPLQLHIMGTGPGHLSTNGQISEFAIYQYTMQEMQILNRWLFTTRYKMSGYTLLQGNPISADVRFYNHTTGELDHTLKSNIVSGLYTYHPETDRLLDVVSYIPENKTTRFRIHGPVKPSEYDDSHLG